MAQGLELTGLRKAAILCVSLGPNNAAEIFKHLSEDQIEKLTTEMTRIPSVRTEHATMVMEEVLESSQAHAAVAEGGIKYARDVLERAVGTARASKILGRLVIDSTPFAFLRGTPPDQIYAFLRHEHPQTIALVLANLPVHDLSAKVVQQLPPELQADVAVRIAQMGSPPPDVVRDVAHVMKESLDNILQDEYTGVGGVESLAQILNSADRGTERNILERLTEANSDLAEKVRALLFVFEDIITLDDRSIQLILKDVDAKDLALALRGTSEEVKEKILANMSQRGAEMLAEEMEYMPPQRRKNVEEAQSKIIAIVRRLEEDGQIVLARGGEDDDLVV
jgi:flagellar motor switch protein FliG